MTIVRCPKALLTGLSNMVPDNVPADLTSHIPNPALAVGGRVVLVDQLDPVEMYPQHSRQQKEKINILT